MRKTGPDQAIQDFLSGDYPPATAGHEADTDNALIENLGLAAVTKQLCGPALPTGDLLTLTTTYLGRTSPYTTEAQRVEGLTRALIVLCVYGKELAQARVLWNWLRMLGVPRDWFMAVHAAQGKSQEAFQLTAAEVARETISAAGAA